MTEVLVMASILRHDAGLCFQRSETMPHLVMEYTDALAERVNIDQLVDDLHQAAIATDCFDPDALKSRAVPCAVWRVGAQADRGEFVHVEFRLLAGRSDQQKQQISNALTGPLRDHAGHVTSLTVEVRDMDTTSYRKWVGPNHAL
ncbi:5-carboxymethyl-2-hydroxymuconate Delta-isomerase [Salinivibrio costicola]|uniref:5-carboxymethyl-2-hydroxymuconate Delta-isomerase n=1 Tax=Salinivibrio costicola TaxID=51367 RepID=UPI003F7294AA